MSGFNTTIVPAVLALVCAAAAMHAPTAAAQTIRVYTWTDANGTTHFSDKPRPNGPVKIMALPTPPPPDQTAVAADRAWLGKLNRETQARLEREAEQRRLEAERATAKADRIVRYAPQPVLFAPLYWPLRAYRRHRRYRHGGIYRLYNDHDRDDRRGRMSRRFPHPQFPRRAWPHSFLHSPASPSPGPHADRFTEAGGGLLTPPHSH